jgi:hypothetical protein
MNRCVGARMPVERETALAMPTRRVSWHLVEAGAPLVARP